MKNKDEAIEKSVIVELAAEGILKPSTIGIAVKDGVVHLFGTVSIDAERQIVKRAVNRATGVRSIVDDLQLDSSALKSADDLIY